MTEEAEILVPDYDDPKELWAYFGLAFYRANVLERGVLNLAVALLSKNVVGLTGNDVQTLYETHDSKTFGQVICLAKRLFEFDEQTEQDLKRALHDRNYLAHDFFAGHDVDLLTESGRKKMLDELVEIAVRLKSIDQKMDPIWMSAWRHLGVTPEWINRQMQLYVQSHDNARS
ncbi:hypothetical protein [Burkholderia ubonensis]|uniref:hypothetical protein n=1 Tax=Burkholderia ubonensis TaxID=101571 RepID=UPI00075ACB16|nr:hypothetical protein [Burkholderia ubonensis]KVZ00841.1 hypothetical protein WL11_21440 [Burkholderia ubonensis]